MKRLENPRTWLAGGGIIALVLVALAWFMFIGPERSSVDSLNAQTAATEQQNLGLQSTLKQLELKSSQLPKYTASLRSALEALPFDSGLPAFTRQLSAQATQDGVTLLSVVVGGVSAVGGSAVPGSAAATPGADTTSTAPATPTGPVSAAGGLFSVQVTVQSTGPFTNQLAFLNAIRTAGPRRALVTSTQVTPGGGAKEASIDGAASFTTALTVFSAPQSPAQIAQLQSLLLGKIGH